MVMHPGTSNKGKPLPPLVPMEGKEGAIQPEPLECVEP